jgi:hypothetical protein
MSGNKTATSAMVNKINAKTVNVNTININKNYYAEPNVIGQLTFEIEDSIEAIKGRQVLIYYTKTQNRKVIPSKISASCQKSKRLLNLLGFAQEAEKDMAFKMI